MSDCKVCEGRGRVQLMTHAKGYSAWLDCPACTDHKLRKSAVSYGAPPVSPEELAKIESRHVRDDTAGGGVVHHVPNQTAAHHDKGKLLQQLDYTVAVIIDLQLKLAYLKAGL